MTDDIMIVRAAPLWQRVLLRGGRAFVAGGLSSLVVILAQAPAQIDHLKPWIMSLVIAFIAGGLMSLDKLLRDTANPPKLD